jgi:hypothetical protein
LNLGLLIAEGFATLLAIVTLASDLVGTRIIRIRRLRRAAPLGPGHRLIGAGVCLACGTIFLTGLGRYWQWPEQRYHGMLSYLMPVMLVAMTLIIAGAVVRARSRRRPTR